ncbi:MAG: class I SAM-dependent methyltransferase [Cyanobium sp.]|jgi:SAM-dependent methyltransferase
MHIDEYRKLAEVEDSMWYFKALNRRMLLPLSDWKDRKADVLDAGCGTGGLIQALKEFGPKWKITGLDFSPLACRLAQERTQVEIIEGSITELPFEQETFDILTSADVISQVEDASIALREFSRVLRPGGIVVINVAAYQWMWSYHDDTCETRHRFRRSELKKMVEASGLAPIKASYANMFVFPMIIAKRKLFATPSATSDVQTYSQPIDQFCGGLASLEHSWLKTGGVFPTGCSVFLAAQKV